MKLWGRDPVVLSNAAAAVLAVLSALVLHFDAHTQTVVNAAVVALLGLFAAVGVQKGDAIVPAAVGFVQAAAAVGFALGWHLTSEQQGLVVAAIAAVGAIFLRPQLIAKYDSNGVRRA